MKILGICGSLQALSANLALLHVAAQSTPRGAEFVLFDGLRELPLFNPDVQAGGAPDSVWRWRRALAESDAVFIAAPEYALSLTGALKNGIDWVIGSGELEGKIIAITAAVPAPERGRCGLRALRGTLSAVHAVIVGGEPIAKGPDFHERVARLVAHLLQVVAHRDGRQGSPAYRPKGLEVGCG
jgi:chromate reductase